MPLGLTVSAMTDKKRLIVDLVSDPVCPWCYVGLKSYFQARDRLASDFDLVTRFRPYQLNPDTPIEGADREKHYEKKFPDPGFRQNMRTRLIEAAANIGFSFDPAIPKNLPNTLAAHRLMRWAHFDGKHEKLADKLYSGFWDDDADIGDIDVLAQYANELGLNGTPNDTTEIKDIKIRLLNNEDSDTVAQEAQSFRTAGVNGVPTFIVNERTGFSGALPPEQLETAIRQAAQQTQS